MNWRLRWSGAQVLEKGVSLTDGTSISVKLISGDVTTDDEAPDDEAPDDEATDDEATDDEATDDGGEDTNGVEEEDDSKEDDTHGEDHAVSILSCNSEPNSDNYLGLDEACAVSADGQIRATWTQPGSGLYVEKAVEIDETQLTEEEREGGPPPDDLELGNSPELRLSSEVENMARPDWHRFMCVALEGDGRVWRTSDSSAHVISVDCGTYTPPESTAGGGGPNWGDCDGDCPQALTPTPTMPEAAAVCLALLMIGAGARQLRRRVE